MPIKYHRIDEDLPEIIYSQEKGLMDRRRAKVDKAFSEMVAYQDRGRYS